MGERMQRTHLRIQEMTQALTATLIDIAAWGLCIGLLAIVFYLLILLPRARERAAVQEEAKQAKRAQRYERREPRLQEQAEPRTKIVYIQEGHIASRSFMTDSEREFFRQLLLALPYYHVFPQVRCC
jgi:flagellar biosynthesis/type III secretory pathway M-ring protein FliF/YscJ